MGQNAGCKMTYKPHFCAIVQSCNRSTYKKPRIHRCGAEASPRPSPKGTGEEGVGTLLGLDKLGGVNVAVNGLDGLRHDDGGGVAFLDGLRGGGDGAGDVATAEEARHRNQRQEKQNRGDFALFVVHVKHHIIYDLIIYNLFIYLAI